MKKNALAVVGSNSSKKLAEFDPELKAIQRLSAKAEKALKGHHNRLHQALVATYKLGLELKEVDMLTLFIGQKTKSMSAKQKTNDFHELVSLAFPNARDDSKSKYRKVLKQAQEDEWTVEDLHNAFAGSETLDTLYTKALAVEKKSGDSRTEDAASAKFEQAKQVLDAQSLGSVTGLQLDAMKPHSVHGYANAVVRQTENGAEVVGFLPVGPQASFERALISLVPSITDRTERRLTKKKLYAFFVICDVFKRIQPDAENVVAQLKAMTSMQSTLELSGEESKDEVVQVLRDRQLGRAEAQKGSKVTGNNIEKAKQVLWLEKQDGNLPTLVENGTILPSMIALEAHIPWDAFKQRARVLRMAADDILNFASDFLRQLEWEDEHTSKLSHLTSSDGGAMKYAFPSVAPDRNGYRLLKTDATPEYGFALTKGTLMALSGWREDFKKSLPRNSKRRFPTLLNVVEDNGYLYLHFPDNPHEKQKLGKITSTPQIEMPLGSNWLVQTRQLESVISLGVDYGMKFEGKLLSMSGAPFGIELNCELPTGPCKMTLPLIVGLAGGFVENTDMFVAPAALPAPSLEDEQRSDIDPK
ncbi:hypothetical protein [Pseudooctadecabacter jejudonensis]|uniref:Uncharacterized protein n=1 Tax=Pseudooctadecabacter jejudonensis TaxID=1391910 RepID=A0A1Y5SJJ1_9RHOB|nr:hypothetical protein [Pseudooctadecabacter jejudonensis]SLN41619.1 hypothetical protein PSJ8397_02092 [Pseudooctadecabacter jejudonensis]